MVGPNDSSVAQPLMFDGSGAVASDGDGDFSIIDGMTSEQLIEIVFAGNGYARFILGTGEPGKGYDGRYSYDQWARARLRLSVIDHLSGTGLAAAHTPLRVPDIEDVRPGARTRGFRDQHEWPLQAYEVMGDLFGAVQGVRLVVELAGAATRTPRAPTPTVRAPSGRPRAAPQALDVGDPQLFVGMPFLDPFAGVADAVDGGIGELAGGLLAGESASADALRPAESEAVAAMTTIAPALSWLAQRAGIAQLAGELLERVFQWHDANSAPELRVYARVAEKGAGVSSEVAIGALYGTSSMQSGRWSLAPSSADDELGEGRGELLMSLKTASNAGVAVVVTGDLQPLSARDLQEAVRAGVEQFIVHAADFWRDWWRASAMAEDAYEFIAYGVHRLLSAERRAQLISVMYEGVCGVRQQRAILQVLEDSIERGDGAQVIHHLGGRITAARALSWMVDGERDAQLRALLERISAT